MDATCARELKRIGLATRVGIIEKQSVLNVDL